MLWRGGVQEIQQRGNVRKYQIKVITEQKNTRGDQEQNGGYKRMNQWARRKRNGACPDTLVKPKLIN